MTDTETTDRRYPLYHRRDEHDGCGVGFLADRRGRYRDDILERALLAIENLMHRGATGSDSRTGDGTGVLFGLPRNFFADCLAESTGREPAGPVGVGVVFWPLGQPGDQRRGRRLFGEILARRDMAHHCWRRVPTRPEVLGVKAADSRPHIEHLVVGFDDSVGHLEAERRLYGARREFEARAAEASLDVYIPSMSARTIVYKGLVMADSLADFYPDLRRGWSTNFAVFHQRFSTNTLPSWPLAQPFRRLGHNGEINTIHGNVNATEMREEDLDSPIWGGDLDVIRPVVQRGYSDSAILDNVVELLSLSGRSLPHSLAMLIPPAWENNDQMPAGVREFFEYHACLNEPWDGPAAVVYGDGRNVGAHLDRNGLRPLRFQGTDDGLICVASEAGVLDGIDHRVVDRRRLGPGDSLVVDLQAGELRTDRSLKRHLAGGGRYGQWLEEGLDRMETVADPVLTGERETGDELVRHQLAFGYSKEEMKFLFEPMTESGGQPVSSMGDDTPISVLSGLPRLLPTYFKQRFAQVTNPPIDPIREESVMSLQVRLGRRRNWLSESADHADKIVVDGPVMTDGDLQRLVDIAGDDRVARLDCTFGIADGSSAMSDRIDALCRRAEEAVDDGADLLVLSDRGVDADHAAIPMLLAVGAVSTHLSEVGKRLRASMIAVSGEPRDVHHFATLIGYGASAVVPYLAIETIIDQCDADEADQPRCDIDNFVASIDKGLLKVMSKMGISTLASYRGAQIFEALGIGPEVIERCFPDTPSPVGGIGFEGLAAEATRRHLRAFGPDEPGRLEDLGYYRFRRGGEAHAWGPKMLGSMMKFRRGDDEAYGDFSTATREESPMHLRDLLELRPFGDPIDVEEVESVESIRRRFTTAAMSLGALSPEAHEALAVAMNRIGGKSNSGEGGEDPARYELRADGDNAESMIKQVASGRFGVTPRYLARAKELEIKMAQGSKPGEGGQLPGHKVTDYIAYLRHATPGVALISPPPHHDIYSIEDLAQLIFDLKTVNDHADICVKLVSEAGVGTVAAGVAKAHADTILISGHDGGTGASPLSSIKNAGNAWETGLAETQQVLRKNGLRERVKLRVDGGLKTGRDIVVAAMLGAEEFNFGTAALISLGCRYVRQCHMDTCPVGIATQRGDLREKFEGDPESVVAYFDAVAAEARQILADLGAYSMDEIVGRTEGLEQVDVEGHHKASTLDLGPLLAGPDRDEGPTLSTWDSNIRPGDDLNVRILEEARPVLEAGGRYEGFYELTNGDRTVGARLAGWLATQGRTLDPASSVNRSNLVHLHFEGVAGQSFGAFATSEMSLLLEGEANDYVAKGLGGGRVAIYHPDSERTDDILVGNTVLYGATDGQLLVAGRAGERFAVRNSGARAVVEGVGDHGCEYMTAGTVVVLGETGHNFGAGMTGGRAFVWDPDRRLERRHHPGFVSLESIESEGPAASTLRQMLREHHRWTASRRAGEMLERFEEYLPDFWHVMPRAIIERSEGAEEETARSAGRPRS